MSSTFQLCGYAEALDPGKAVVSATLPNDPNVEILAMDLVNANSSAIAGGDATTLGNPMAAFTMAASDGTLTGATSTGVTTSGGSSSSAYINSAATGSTSNARGGQRRVREHDKAGIRRNIRSPAVWWRSRVFHSPSARLHPEPRSVKD